ncbi:MAG: copper-binding protein [Myxococcales bacterium]|nr:copper-binding protein [Myxococcales bacterium]
MRLTTLAVLALASTIAFGCSKSSSSGGSATGNPGTAASDLEVRTAKGVIKSVDAAAKTATIDHEDIPNYMKAMTMKFDVESAALLTDVKAGDKVEFTFTETKSGGLLVTKLKKL